AGEHAGSYPITQGTLAAGTNYTIAFTGANLTITKGQLAVTASSASKVYGAALPVFAYTIAGYVNGDTQAILTGSPSITTIATAASGAGSYPITISPGTLSTADYTFVFTDATLTVTPATLTVTANAQSKVYGSADPALTYSQSGLVNGDTAAVITGALARQTGENVGSYGILQGTLSAGGNYSIVYSGASLTISKATPVVSWNNPAAIFVGTALGATQLSASASAPGTLVYTPAAGTVLAVGSGQTLSVTFTPSDLANYNVPGPKTVSIDVLPAGDLDGSGTVGLSDAVYYLQVALGAAPAPASVATPVIAPIVNGKPQPDPSRTKVNVLDVIAVLEKLVGKW
ncbi:MBG domain-containing protein, partial [Geomonas sp.]|uniref:MBG domain-containing protein n=1 Tax=Geomonas sp. TaxID=2651584 RepID=UPI002B472992